MSESEGGGEGGVVYRVLPYVFLEYVCVCTTVYINTIFCLFAVKADQQSKASTSQAPSATSGGEPMDITTSGDVTKVLVS